MDQKLKPHNMPHYNTTAEIGRQRELFEQLATNQDEKVIDLFKRFNRPLSPSQVFKYYLDSSNVPITSIRRSINTLTNQGKLIKTQFKIDGMYGRPEYLWKLKNRV